MRSSFNLLALLLLLPGVSTRLCAEPAGSGYYRRVLYSKPVTLDPISAGSGSEIQVVRQLFDQLISQDKDFSWRPVLASGWTISDGGRVYTFQIRKGIKFSDGTEMTPEDIVFSFKRVIKDPSSRWFSDFLKIKGAKEYREGKAGDVAGLKIAGDSLVLTSEKPNPYLLYILSGTGGSVIKRGSPAGAAGRVPVGTGPFTLKCMNEKGVLLAANKEYFLGAPKLPGVEYYIYANKEDAFRDFLAKKLEDIAPYNLPPSADRAGLKRVFTNGIISFMLVLNPQAPPLDNKYLRQAIVAAADFDAILAKSKDKYPLLFRGRTYIPKGRIGYDASYAGLAYSPEQARQLLRKAGYKNFSEVPPIEFQFTGNVPYTEELAEGLRSYYSKIGLRFEYKKVGKIDGGNAKRPWQLRIVGTDWLYVDSYLLLSAFHSRSPVKSLTRNDKKLDALLDKCEVEMNPALRLQLFRQINEILVGDAHLVPLFSGDMFDGSFQRWVEGIQYPNTAFFDLPMYPVSLNPKLSGERPAMSLGCGK